MARSAFRAKAFPFLPLVVDPVVAYVVVLARPIGEKVDCTVVGPVVVCGARGRGGGREFVVPFLLFSIGL